MEELIRFIPLRELVKATSSREINLCPYDNGLDSVVDDKKGFVQFAKYFTLPDCEGYWFDPDCLTQKKDFFLERLYFEWQPPRESEYRLYYLHAYESYESFSKINEICVAIVPERPLWVGDNTVLGKLVKNQYIRFMLFNAALAEDSADAEIVGVLYDHDWSGKITSEFPIYHTYIVYRKGCIL